MFLLLLVIATLMVTGSGQALAAREVTAYPSMTCYELAGESQRLFSAYKQQRASFNRGKHTASTVLQVGITIVPTGTSTTPSHAAPTRQRAAIQRFRASHAAVRRVMARKGCGFPSAISVTQMKQPATVRKSVVPITRPRVLRNAPDR